MKSRITTSIFTALLASTPALAVESPFDVPWIGYDTSTYPQLFPYASQSADFNGDGVPDLACVTIGGNAWLSVLIGDGAGGYLPPQTQPLQIESMDLDVADFDNDGDLDIVTSDTGRFWEGISISLYRNDGAGNFTFVNWYNIGNTGPSGIIAADFNGDGWIDVATANDAYIACNNTVSVLFNNAGNGFALNRVYSISSCTNDIDAGDVDGDGWTDLVVGHESNRFTVMTNDQDGTFTALAPHTGVGVGSIPEEPVVHLSDIDLDGDLDVFFSNRDTGGFGAGAVGLFRNTGGGNLAPGEAMSFNWYNGGAIDVDTADVTGDGWPDVLCATGDSGNWFLFESDGAGGFTGPRRLRAGHSPSAIDTTDLDQDGDVDVIVIGALSIEACVYLNPGDGSFVQPGTIDFADPDIAPAFTTNIEAGDIDADGDLDLAVGFRSDFEDSFGTTIRRNNGDGTFGPMETYDEFTYAEWIRFCDTDNDGDLDLIWVENDGRFRSRFNDGTGAFGPRVNSSTVGLGRYFEMHDVDKDGDDDIVVGSGFSVAVLRNNGAGIFAQPMYTDIGGFFEVLALGDFDADGNLDLLTDSAPQGYPQISFGNGDGTFGQAFTVATGRGVKSMAIEDFDQDGNLDFAAVFNLDEKGLSLRRGRGGGNFFISAHYTGSFQWDDYTLGGRTETIDVDGDGDLDVLFANVKAQDFTYWENNGDGTFARAVRCGVGHNVHDLVAGDFTGDGVVDVAMSTEVEAGRWWYTGVVLIAGTSGAGVPGDANGDGTVDFQDLVAILGAWGPCDPTCPEDLDGDGFVTFQDILIVLANWS